MDNERLKREAFKGDKDAATQMLYEAARQDRWDLINLISAAIIKGDPLGNILKLKLGQIYFKESLDLRDTEISKLPDNLTIEGSLFIEGSWIEELPENLTIGGDLDLSNTLIRSLPENLTIRGVLYLGNTGINMLPYSIKLKNTLGTKSTGDFLFVI